MPETSTTDAETFAVVLAGGTGARMGSSRPKQLLEVGGRPVLRHSLEAFQASPLIDRILLVMAEGHHAEARRIAEAAGVSKLAGVIGGGKTRSDSSRAAVEWIAERAGPECKVLVHDAARMLVSGRVIAGVVGALDHSGAVTVAIPTSDTVVEVSEDGGGEFIAAVPDRSRLRRVQTPQGFRLGVIGSAFEAAAADADFAATDDCSVVLRFRPDVPVRVVAGEERNLKVTEPIDLVVAEALLAH